MATVTLDEIKASADEIIAKPKLRTLEEINASAENLVKKFNEAVRKGNFTESANLNDKIKQEVNEYTSIARKAKFDELKASDDPMLEAVKCLTFESIRAVDKKDDGIPYKEIVPIDKEIDLYKLHKYVGGDGIGHDKDWPYIIEKINMLLTVKTCQELDIDPTEVYDSYAMHDIAKKIDLGETPTSNTNILKTLNMAIAAMIGEGKATTKDVRFLLKVYTSRGQNQVSFVDEGGVPVKKITATVRCSRHRYMRSYMAAICHRIVTNGVYGADFKKKKKK